MPSGGSPDDVKRFGPYRVEREIARGGMGAVFEAVHETTGAHYALKTLHPDILGAGAADELARFRREAEVLAKLDHPHVARIHTAVLEGPSPYLVQDLLAGGTLRARVEGEAVAIDAALAIVAKLARGVQHCHERGVLHRDLKPENVLFDDHGEPVLVDFGLAYVSGAARRLTQTGSVMGTPSCMAPEQARGEKHVDARTDVYGLGALLYFLLTGAAPFPEGSLYRVLDSVINERPAPPSRARSDVPAWVDAVCLRALEKDPGGRFQTADELVKALDSATRPSASPSRRALSAAITIAGVGVLLGVLAWRRAEPASRDRPVSRNTSEPSEPLPPTPTPPPARRDALGRHPERVLHHVSELREGFGSPCGGVVHDVAGPRAITWGRSQELKLWQLDSDETPPKTVEVRAVPTALAVTGSDAYVAYPASETLDWRSSVTGAIKGRILLPTENVVAMAVSPDGQTIAIAALRIRLGIPDTTLCLLTVGDETPRSVRRVRSVVSAVALSERRLVVVTLRDPDAQRAPAPQIASWQLPLSSATDPGEAKWDDRSPDWEHELPASGRSVALSADDRFLAVGCDLNQLLLFDGDAPAVALQRSANDGPPVNGAHEAPVWGLVFAESTPPVLISGSGDPTNPDRGAALAVWDLVGPEAFGERLRIARPQAITSLSRHGSLLAANRLDACTEFWRLQD